MYTLLSARVKDESGLQFRRLQAWLDPLVEWLDVRSG
jgi:hypothetical protein